MQREPQVQRPWGRNVSGELEEQQGSWVVQGNEKRGRRRRQSQNGDKGHTRALGTK